MDGKEKKLPFGLLSTKKEREKGRNGNEKDSKQNRGNLRWPGNFSYRVGVYGRVKRKRFRLSYLVLKGKERRVQKGMTRVVKKIEGV